MSEFRQYLQTIDPPNFVENHHSLIDLELHTFAVHLDVPDMPDAPDRQFWCL